MIFKRFKEDKVFYRRIITISLPLILQQFINAIVLLLVNLMVGNYNILAMSGVSVANQVFFIINVVVLGSFLAPGIFIAQFTGAGDVDGIQNCVRYKLWSGLIVFIISLIVIYFFGDTLIRQFLKNNGKPEDVEAIFNYAKIYLKWTSIDLFPYIITQIFAGTLRKTGETVLPMKTGLVSVFINLILSFFLINGFLGIPSMGINGSGIAITIAYVVEMLIIIIVSYRNQSRFVFLIGLFKTIKIKITLVKKIILKGAPFLTNEFFWALGMTTVIALYTRRGTDILVGLNIAGTFTGLFGVVFNGIAITVSVIVGQSLGLGRLEEAVISARKITFFNVFVCLILGIILAISSYFLPMFYYKASIDVRHLATLFMLVVALCYPINGYNSSCFHLLRVGGGAYFAFIFDSIFVWFIYIPLAYFLVTYTTIGIVWVYLIVHLSEIIKSLIGYQFVSRKFWVKNLAQASLV